MIKITFIGAAGDVHTVEAKVDHTLMEAAVKNDVPGIAADCGGACACATCRVRLDGLWRAKAGEPDDMERAMLDSTEAVSNGIRLSCQIRLTEELDGLVAQMPESQHEPWAGSVGRENETPAE